MQSGHKRPSYENIRTVCNSDEFVQLGELLIDGVTEVRDLDHFLMSDGSIIVAQGWTHPEGIIIGEPVYRPHATGNKRLFGLSYRKAYLDEDGSELPYTQRERVRTPTGIAIDYAHCFKYRSMFPRNEVIARFDVIRSIDDVLGANPAANSAALADLMELRELLGDTLDGAQLGMTGSMRLGGAGDDGFHDLDVMITGSASNNRQIIKRLASLALEDPSRRVQEFGKGWRIRLLTENGLLCCFFGYRDPTEAPLHGLRSMSPVVNDVELRGRVVDDTHNSYMPTVVTIEPMDNLSQLPGDSQGLLPIVITHLGARGDFHEGDVVRLRGTIVEVDTGADIFHAMSIVERDGTELLTPPWPDYYTTLDLGPSGITRHAEEAKAVIPIVTLQPTEPLGINRELS